MTKDYTQVTGDGSCSGNPGPGGWAARIDAIDGKIYRVSGGESTETTNNRMELKAIIEGLRKANEVCPNDDIIVYSDSQYVVNSMKNSWKRKKNTDLWDELDEVTSKRVSWRYVPRNSTPEHKECDKLAKLETRKAQYPSADQDISTDAKLIGEWDNAVRIYKEVLVYNMKVFPTTAPEDLLEDILTELGEELQPIIDMAYGYKA